MTLAQGLAFAIVVVMMALFVWGRWRYDLVAAIALLAAVIVGVVPPDQAFKGFSDDIVIIVGSALVVSAAVARSGIIERVARWIGPYLTDINRQIVALVGSVTVLSAFVKNVGALAMLMPIAFQLARRSGTSPSSLLMPMSFGALLGGIVTLVGTSPNIIVSRVREQLLGQPFNMFDFTPVGAGIAIAGFAFLVFGWRRLPRNRKGSASMEAAFNLEGYTTEVTVPEDSPAAGITVKALEDLGEGEIEVITLLRGGSRRHEPAGNVVIKPGDILILQGEPAALERIVALEKLELTREGKSHEIDTPSDEIGVMEAVVTPELQFVGSSVGQLKLFDRHAVNLLAVSSQRPPHHPPFARGEAPGGRRRRAQGQSRRHAWDAGRAALPAAGRARPAHRPKSERRADPRAHRRHGAGRLQRGPCGHSLFRRRGRFVARAVAQSARGLRRDRMADPHHAGGAHPGQRCVAHDGRH